MPAVSTYMVNLRRREFCRLRTTTDLAMCLGTPLTYLTAAALRPEYHLFSIPKKDGSFRQIEDPAPPLKEIQDILNTYLQAVYHQFRPDAAYGFIIGVKGEPQPRNIVSHAHRHLGCRWLYNADVEDCFHQVKTAHLEALFQRKPFRFDEQLSRLLALLCTNLGRLPMGAPTSPILSNFAMQLLDEEFLGFARSNGWTYTRYADDLSFSSENPIMPLHRQMLRNLAANHGFPFNPEKEKLMGPRDVKVVTGLVISEDKVSLPEGYLDELDNHIQRLAGIAGVQSYMQWKPTLWVNRYTQKIQGMLAFAEAVLGEHHPTIQGLYRNYEKAIRPPDTHELFSWLDFPYH